MTDYEHPGSIFKYKVRQSAFDYLDKPIHEAHGAMKVTTVTLTRAAIILVDNWVISQGIYPDIYSQNTDFNSIKALLQP